MSVQYRVTTYPINSKIEPCLILLINNVPKITLCKKYIEIMTYSLTNAGYSVIEHVWTPGIIKEIGNASQLLFNSYYNDILEKIEDLSGIPIEDLTNNHIEYKRIDEI